MRDRIETLKDALKDSKIRMIEKVREKLKRCVISGTTKFMKGTVVEVNC